MESKSQTLAIAVAKIPKQTRDECYSPGNKKIVVPRRRIDVVAQKYIQVIGPAGYKEEA